ncbi:hypothetical protein AWB80_02731 [Caballeronia pedi]|uniref:Uncharacterized protein n=1 Tax=Caballeronia pedi TaxID=1777141 RepID=A0A158AX23_9BURK|nr:hypothetical protein [Caballeronia pedi]SAK61996.1 hypothetical protein AWB80_02731 [Caballeronia pedi]
MGNRYQYGMHTGLEPAELFFLIAIAETYRQTAIEDLTSIAMILLGQPFLPTRGKFKFAVKGTSVASIVSRTMLPIDIKYRILPTVTSFSSLMMLRVKFTSNLGAFVGRAIPGVGWVLLATDVSTILFRSVQLYNDIVKPEDRL